MISGNQPNHEGPRYIHLYHDVEKDCEPVIHRYYEPILVRKTHPAFYIIALTLIALAFLVGTRAHGQTNSNGINGGFSRNNVTGNLNVTGSVIAGSSVASGFRIQGSFFNIVGSRFAASGCTNSGLTGGASAGTFISGTTGTCTVVVTMGQSATAANDWSCTVRDTTTPADTITQSGATSTTTATFTGTTVSGDVLSFACIAH
jgi:hypothetical protein